MKPTEMIAVLEAHMQGKAIQFRSGEADWKDVAKPAWNFLEYEYRIKPERAAPIIRYLRISHEHWAQDSQRFDDNLQLVFDGETGKLLSAEVLV